MKKFYFLLILSCLFYNKANACEICGCGHSNFQIGLLPNFTKGFVGVRYGYSQFNSHLKDDASEFSHDYYQNVELWGGYNFKKLQVMTFVPYVISRKESDDGIIQTNGLGDWMILLNYRILSINSISKNEKVTRQHELYAGGGIKLPTGSSRVNTADPEFNVGDFNSQAGTGSVDYVFNLTHNFLWNKSGIVTNAAYRINTANNDHYQFGNRMYLSSSYYYTITKSETKIKPNAGINYQQNAVNTFAGTEVEDSKGYNFNGTAGINVLHGKIGVNALVFIPLAQNNYDGQTQLKKRVIVGVTYSF